jgi:hypothetical protein
MWVTSPRSASSGYHEDFDEGYYQKNTNLLNCRTSSSDISGYHVDFHEGHGTVRDRWGHVMAWARHGMCELALSVLKYVTLSCVNGLFQNSTRPLQSHTPI